ncbi:MAG: hypothetical protein ACTHLN_00990 [Tepidisphaeraceae bacterium]
MSQSPTPGAAESALNDVMQSMQPAGAAPHSTPNAPQRSTPTAISQPPARPVQADSDSLTRDFTHIAGPLLILIAYGALAFYRRAKRKRRPPAAAPAAANVVPTHPLIAPPRQKPADPDAAPARIVPIDLVRQLMGEAPRTFDPSLSEYLHADPPRWLSRPGKKDEMLQPFIEQERLRRDGRVVWAVTVQANSLIFQPGPTDHGASVIWSYDPYFDERPGELAQIAHELFLLKGTDQSDPETATFARMLTNELTRAMGLKVPARFTAGRKVFHSSLMLTRRHLPQGFLSRNVLPVWVDPNPTGLVLLVPAAFWPASLLFWWKTPDAPQEAQPSETE